MVQSIQTSKDRAAKQVKDQQVVTAAVTILESLVFVMFVRIFKSGRTAVRVTIKNLNLSGWALAFLPQFVLFNWAQAPYRSNVSLYAFIYA